MGEIDLEGAELSAAQMFGELLNCGFVIAQTAPEFKVIYVNDIIVKMLGYDDAEELKHQVITHPMSFVHPDDVQRMKEKIIAKQTKADQMQELSFRIRKKDGKYLWITKRCTKKTYESGKQYCLACYTDITYLMEEKERLKRVLKNVPAGLIVLSKQDEKISLVMANDYMFRLKSEDEKQSGVLMLNDLLDMVYVEDREIVDNAIQKMFTTRKDSRVEFRIIEEDNQKDQKQIWMFGTGKTELQPDGGMKAFINLINITNLKETEEQLKMERQKNRLAMENSPISFMMWDYDPYQHRINNFRPVNHYTSIGPTIENIPESMIKAGAVAPEYVDKFREMFEKIDHGEKQVEAEIGLYDKESNEMRLCNFSIRMLFDKNGKITGGVGCSVDITENRILENRYQSEIACMLNATEYDLLGKARINLSQNYVEYCENESLNFNYSKHTFDELVKGITDRCIVDQQKECVKKKLNSGELIRLFRKGTSQFNLKYQRIIKPDYICWVKTQVRMYPNPTNGDVMCFIYMYNIQKSMLREEVIKHIIKKDYEMVGQIIMPLGELQCIIGSNLYNEILEDVDHIYMKGLRKFVDRYIPEWSRKEAYTSLCLPYICGRLRENGRYVCSFSLNVDGKIKRKYWNFAFLDESETRIVVTRTDITQAFMQQQKQAEGLKHALEEAKKASEAKTEFLSRMSHDIRTPLNSIINMNRFAQRDMDKTDELTEDLKQVETAGKFLLGLINDILDMSRIESGRIELHPEVYEYKRFLGYIDCIVRPLCNEKNIQFNCEMDAEQTSIYVDIIRFNQVFFNILTNAVKYTPEGGTIFFEMNNEQVINDKFLCDFVIRDTGIGMSKEFQKRAFEPFEREYHCNGVNEGSGLGLAIAARIVKLMGGRISLKSEPGKGTEFTIHMEAPIVQTEIDAPEIKAMSVDNIETLAGRRALVVEDFKPNRDIIVKLLQEDEMVSECAENGRAACEKFLKSEPGYFDIIMMDIRMPVMDGLTATRLIRKSPHPDALTIPIVAMTANAFEEDKKQSLEAGINEHLAKPINVGELKMILHQLLN